jgi:hypothetical protein
MSDNFVLGMECKLYFDDTPLTAEATGAEDWTEMDNVKDVTQNGSTGEADISTRANNGFKATAPTLKDASIDFDMGWKPADPAFAAIQAAWAGREEIAIAAMDGDIAVVGSQGLAGNFVVTNFSRSEPLNEAVTVKVTLKPSSFTSWLMIAA